jgi:hypothetical protein
MKYAKRLRYIEEFPGDDQAAAVGWDTMQEPSVSLLLKQNQQPEQNAMQIGPAKHLFRGNGRGWPPLISL